MAAIDLADYTIPGYEEAYYIPNFVTDDEEQYLIRKICESPRQKWKQLANRRLQLWGGEITAKKTLISQPMPAFLTTYPDIIPRIKSTRAFNASAHGAPNHVILNEYSPGQGIMPHEDGPAYFPVVTTISLGSHAVFHYYQYKTDPSAAASESPRDTGRIIDTNPVLSVILEPKSAIITTGSLYTSHLHGIRDVEEDRIIPGDESAPPKIADLDAKIANWTMLTGDTVKRIMREGGVLTRNVRYSLTCRDVERVVSAAGFLKH